MRSICLASLFGLLSLLPTARTGWKPNSDQNVVVYWGQNSAKIGQSALSYYCDKAPDIDVINISFLVGITSLNLNLANIGNDCTSFPQAPNLLNCPQVEADIIKCQQTYGKTIMLSLFGSTYTESGFSSSGAAVSAAREIWAMFGPVQSGNSTPRPFGTAIIDGFDIDLEDPVENNMEPFVAELKNLMDASASKKFYLSAAPQCVYPDKADESFLNGQVPFDWVNVQFYNNGCGVSHYPSDFNWATWDNWAKTVSANKNAKVLIGTPANVGGANVDSFPTDLQLSGAILLAKRSSSFGGVMLWDMAQLFANAGYLAKVVADLGSSSSSLTHPPVAFAALQTVIRPSATIMSPTSPPVSDGSVPQWGQCGGIGYSGPTQCQSPFICITTSEWWSQCK